jgi:progressive ankylosis protein
VTDLFPPRPPARLRDAYKFFVPLMFMAELMMISHAIVAAFLARMDNPQPILAAYSVSFAVHGMLGSPVWACQIIFLSYIRDRWSMLRLAMFGLQAFASVLWIWLALAVTPLGDWFFKELFGVSQSVADSAKLCMLAALLIPPSSIIRSLAYGLLMVERKTIFVTLGTSVRLITLGIFLAIMTEQFEGAVVGVLAMAACVALEAVVAVAIAYPAFKRLPVRVGPPPTYRELWRFSWPIMIMQTAESGVTVTANFFLGKLARPELALAAFGVMDSIMRVLLHPLRNLIHTTQTLVRTRADAKMMAVFTLHMTVLFSGLTLLFHVPWVRDRALLGVMGLPADMAAYITPALELSGLLAIAMGAAGLTRGMLIASKNTSVIALTSGARIAAVAGVGAIGVALEVSDGAMVGLLAMAVAFGSEGLILGIRLVQLDRREPLFTAKQR